MKRYNVRVFYVESAYVEVEAENPDDAEDKAYEAVQNGEVDFGNSFDEPDWEFEVEEIEDGEELQSN